MNIFQISCILISISLWSLTAPVAKILLTNLDPLFLQFSKFLIVSLFGLPYLLLRKNKIPSKKIMFSILGVSFLSFVCGNSLNTFALKIVSNTNIVGFINLLVPVVTAMLGIFVLNERFSLKI